MFKAINESDSQQGVAQAYTDAIDALKHHLEDCVISLEGRDPEEIQWRSCGHPLNLDVLNNICGRIKSAAERLNEMVLKSVPSTNTCFLKQGN